MKERLTGAIILVALMVLLVPELLTGPIRTKSAPALAATALSSPAGPPAHGQPLRTYTLTLSGAPTAADSALPSQPAESPQPSAAQAPAASSADGTSPSATHASSDRKGSHQGAAAGGGAASITAGLQPAHSAAHPVLREASSSASSRGWVVQLGSFADHQNAVRLARSLGKRGFPMSVSPGKAGSRTLWRVRAGPAHDRAGAQHLAARLRALGHPGEILPAR